MDLTSLGLSKPGARGSHPSTNELRDALRANGDRLETILLGLGAATQEGVLDIAHGLVYQTAPTTAHVPAGIAWIAGDGAGGLNGRYRVTWPDTDLTIPVATGGNTRGHRITVPVPAGGHGVSAPVVHSGVDNATVTLDTLDTNAGAVGGVPALAAGELQIAVALSNNAGLLGIRDRRRYALGFSHYYELSDGTPFGTNSVVTPVSLHAGAFDFRAECDGVNPLTVRLDGHVVVNAASSHYAVQLLDNGTVVRQWDWNSAVQSPVSLNVPRVPSAGSHKFTWRHFVDSATTSGLTVSPIAGHLYVTATERLGGTPDNGTA